MKNLRKSGFSLIELLVVIVLIAIISVIVFVNFGNQTPKARNAMRLDSSSKILTAFQLANLEEKISQTSCINGSSEYILTGTLSGTGCNVILDGSQESKNFLKNLKITGTFQDPLNETKGNDDFLYEFNYKLGTSQQEFVYLSEPVDNTSFLNTHALNYQSGSVNKLNIDGNYSSVDKIISPIILKDNNGNDLISELYSTGIRNGKEKIISFNKSNEFNNLLKSYISYSGSVSSGNQSNVINRTSFFTSSSSLKFNNKIGKPAAGMINGENIYFFKKIGDRFFYSYSNTPSNLYSTDLNIENQNTETNELGNILKFENNVITFYNRRTQNGNLIFEFYTYNILTKNKTLIGKTNEYSGNRNSYNTNVASINGDKIYVFVTSPSWGQVCDKIDVYNVNDISFYTSLNLVYPGKTYPAEGLYPSYVNILNDGTVKIDYELVNGSWVPRKIGLDGNLNLLTGTESVEWYGNQFNDMRNLDIMKNKYYEFSNINLTPIYPNITVTKGYYLEHLDSYLIDNGGFHLIKTTNDPYYKYNDGDYASSEITNSNTGIYIKVDSSIPNRTDYKFYLANGNSQTDLWNENNMNVDIMMDRINIWDNNLWNQVKGQINVGGIITLTKNGTSQDFTISTINDGMGEIRLNSDAMSFWGAKASVGSSNFKEISKTKLNGNTLINLEDEFGTLTNSLWYKIELIGDSNDNTKTPIINSVQFFK